MSRMTTRSDHATWPGIVQDTLRRWVDDRGHRHEAKRALVAHPIELRETEGEYIVRMEVPGVRRADLDVTCSERTLTITGERREDPPQEKGAVRHTEHVYGSFSRTVMLPSDVVHGALRARYADGLLEVHLPKLGAVDPRGGKARA